MIALFKCTTSAANDENQDGPEYIGHTLAHITVNGRDAGRHLLDGVQHDGFPA